MSLQLWGVADVLLDLLQFFQPVVSCHNKILGDVADEVSLVFERKGSLCLLKLFNEESDFEESQSLGSGGYWLEETELGHLS